MQPGAVWTLGPTANRETVRTLYFFRGPSLEIADQTLRSHAAVMVRNDVEVRLQAGAGECEVLLLQARPIGEPVVQYGPFVMNSRAEIQTAIQAYQRTRFGGWPWPSDDPVHAAGEGRFARHADGRIERLER
jgi:redox-sensitive bicupin YhaK (pirin superfamily)